MSPLRYSNIPESIPWSRSRVHNFLLHSHFLTVDFIKGCTVMNMLTRNTIVFWVKCQWKVRFCEEVWEVVTPSSRGVWSSLTVRWKAETFYFSLKRTNLMFSEHKVSASWTTDSQISKISSSQPTLIFGEDGAYFICM